jgi:hypothetical protein
VSNRYDLIRLDVRDSIDRYVSHGIPLGGFLQAVISNDLMGAAASADAENSRVLAAIAGYVWNEVPAQAWGSRAVYEAWLALHAAERDPDGYDVAGARAAVNAAYRASRGMP